MTQDDIKNIVTALASAKAQLLVASMCAMDGDSGGARRFANIAWHIIDGVEAKVRDIPQNNKLLTMFGQRESGDVK